MCRLRSCAGPCRRTSSRSTSRRRNGSFRRSRRCGLVVDMIEWCAREMPLMHPVSISGYHIREAGSTAGQELAFTLADGFAYVDACIERGMDVDEFAPRLSFFFNAHLDFFEEIAKYRAARRIWATQMRDKYGAKDPRSLLMRFHAQTAGVSLTAQQPEVNLIRTAIEALGGGAGWNAVAAHEQLRRGARAPDRERGAARVAHAAGDRARDRSGEHDRSARRLLLSRAVDQRAGAAGLRLLRPDREAGRGDPGDQGELLPARDRRSKLPLPVRGGEGAARDRRRQPLRAIGRAAAGDPAHRPRARDEADRARAGAARATRQRRGREPRSHVSKQTQPNPTAT